MATESGVAPGPLDILGVNGVNRLLITLPLPSVVTGDERVPGAGTEDTHGRTLTLVVSWTMGLHGPLCGDPGANRFT